MEMADPLRALAEHVPCWDQGARLAGREDDRRAGGRLFEQLEKRPRGELGVLPNHEAVGIAHDTIIATGMEGGAQEGLDILEQIAIELHAG